MNRDPTAPRHVISVAADLVGIHPQTLRAYERVGLVRPARSPGGGRRYSDADVQHIARITELAGLGLPHIGIKLVLELEGELRRLKSAQPAPRPEGAQTTTNRNPRRTGEAVRISRRIN